MRRATSALIASVLALAAHSILAQDAKLRTIHVFVALADNQHQGIVPVAATLGNGEDAERNLYWDQPTASKHFSRDHRNGSA